MERSTRTAANRKYNHASTTHRYLIGCILKVTARRMYAEKSSVQGRSRRMKTTNNCGTAP
jgi:hypothetical protein